MEKHSGFFHQPAGTLTFKSRIISATQSTLEFLANSQQKNGEFRSLEFYPQVAPEKGWFYIGPSPFIHSNILLSVRDINHSLVPEIQQKGADFLVSLKEKYDLFRFWPHPYPEHKVPPDMDDTALASFVLGDLGIKLKNRDIMLKNSSGEGYFNTWIFAQKAYRWKWGLNSWLKKDWKLAHSAQELGFLSKTDSEPAVAANVLLYLGELQETLSCIKTIQIQVVEKNYSLQYYHDPLATFYHIVRAAEYSIPTFKQLYPEINEQLPATSEVISNGTRLQQALLLSIRSRTSSDHPRTKELAEFMSIIPEFSTGKWSPHPYFNSKNGVFVAGSPELTAAFCLKSLWDFEKSSGAEI